MSSKCEVEVLASGETFICKPEESVLAGMLRLRGKLIPVGCRGGGCGVCKIKIISGDYHVKKMSRAHVTEDEEKQGFALACRCFPAGDLHVEVVEPTKKNDFD